MPRFMKTPYSIESKRSTNAVVKKGANTNAVVAAAEVDLSEVMEAIRSLERKIDGRAPVDPDAIASVQDKKIEEIRTEIADITGRIQATKVEITASDALCNRTPDGFSCWVSGGAPTFEFAAVAGAVSAGRRQG